MNAVRRLTPGTHGQNDGGRAGDDVTAGPDASLIGLAGFLIGIDVTPLI